MKAKKTKASDGAADAGPVDVLGEITRLAELQFDLREVARIVGLHESVLTGPGPERDAYDRGLLLAQANVRQAIYKMAKDGSTPAQKQMTEFMTATARANERILRRK